jgi:tetratricopeptide (TPR) repeat protein
MIVSGNSASFPLERLEALYERGFYVQAWKEGSAWGNLRAWPTPAGQVLAGRLAFHLGAPRFSLRLQARAWRRNLRNYHAAYSYSWQILQYRGPLAAWDFLELYPDEPDLEPWLRADILGARSRCAAYLRDFQTAEALLRRAEELAPHLPWLHVERAALLELQDRYEEALAETEKAFAVIPNYRAAVQSKAQLLELLNRDEEALDCLQEAGRAIECSGVAAQLLQLQLELQQFDAALETADQYVLLAPLMEEHVREWLEYRRCDALYFSGAINEASDAIGRLTKPAKFYTDFAQRLRGLVSQGKTPERKILPIGFIRQHHMTCGPATLTSIARYWDKPANHLEVAEKICYDGTSAVSERLWAEQNGFAALEFRVTPEAVIALIERDIPFTLATVEATNAHLQAGIGYDRCRQSLFVRDPSIRSKSEFNLTALCEAYASTGPRGLALVPGGQSQRLAGLNLPEAAIYDQNHALSVALERNDRETALRVFEKMQADAPGHRLTLGARRALAIYDGNTSEHLEAVDALLQLFPGTSHLQINRLSLLRGLGRRKEVVDWLKEVSLKREIDPALLQEYANELAADARLYTEAMRLLKRARRFRRADGINLYVTAHIHWQRGEFERATLLYRFALCLNDKSEQYANSYFIACRHLGRAQEALRFLSDRFERFGAKSGSPAMTLFEAYEQMDMLGAGFAVVERALALRPADGELQLFAAHTHGRFGDFKRANELLTAARPVARRYSWLRAAAFLKECSSDLAGALEHWMELLKQDPLAVEAVRAAARLLDITHGRPAALEFIGAKRVCFPHHFPIQQLLYEYSREEPLPKRLSLVETLRTLNPADTWALRELAMLRAEEQDLPAAYETIEQAIAIDPNDSWNYSHLAWLERRRGNLEAARLNFRRAIELSADNSEAVEGLVATCHTLPEKKQELAWLAKNFGERSVLGAGMLSIPGCAAGILVPAEVEQMLNRVREKHTDAWEVWSALGTVLAEAQRLDEALAIAGEAARRFPLLPRLWRDLARVHRARMDHAQEIEALTHGLKINFRWDALWLDLALAQERAGKPDESISTLEKALLHAPQSHYLHGLLGDFLLRYRSPRDAVEPLKRAVELETNYRLAWDWLDAAADKLQQPDLARDLARSVVSRRAGDVNAWFVLINRLDKPEEQAERLEAIEKTIRLNPGDVEARIWKCIALVEAQRFEEAKAAAAPADWLGPIPPLLQARAAWVIASMGHLPEAARQMQRVLEQDPSLHWGWTQLCSWRMEMEDFKGAMEPVQALLQMDPHAPVTHGWAGYVKLRNGLRDEAKEHLRRALRLDPSYSFAGYHLVQAEIDDGRWAEASTALDLMGPNANPVVALEKRIHIATGVGRVEDGLQLFRELCECPDATSDQILSAFQRFNSVGQRRLRRLLSELVAKSGAHSIIGTIWILNQTKNGKWWMAHRVDRLRSEHGALGQAAVIAYIQELGKILRRNRHDLRRFCLIYILRKNRNWLKNNDWGWGMVGFALSSVSLHRKALKWLSDYNTRKGVEPWMMHNYIESCHILGLDQAAHEATGFALKLPFYDKGAGGPLVWGAMEAALAGDCPKARERLGRAHVLDLTAVEKTVRAAAELVIEFQEAAPRQRKCAVADRKIMLALYNAHPNNKWARNARKRFFRLLRQKHGDWWSRFILW